MDAVNLEVIVLVFGMSSRPSPSRELQYYYQK